MSTSLQTISLFTGPDFLVIGTLELAYPDSRKATTEAIRLAPENQVKLSQSFCDVYRAREDGYSKTEPDTGVHVIAATLTDIFYIARKYTRSLEKAQQAVSGTLSAMAVLPS
ncbi:MAG: hypothetical protein WBG63_09845 [Phormidesmis sp.]